MRPLACTLCLALPVILAGCTSDAPPAPSRNDAATLDADASAEAGMDATVMDVPAPDAPDGGAADVPPDFVPLRPPPIPRTMTEAALAARRQSCAFGAGAWAAETLGMEVPIGDAIPIQHVLILMQENRSFDHYFSQLPAFGQPDVEVPPAGWTNPRADGTPVPRAHDTHFCQDDTNHEWSGSLREFHGGLNDGFVVANEPHGERAMVFEDGNDLPFYYDLATAFTIADHYHSAVLGPTWPNRLYVMCATSFGLTQNTVVTQDTAAHPVDSIFRRFDAAGLEWRDYAVGARMLGFLLNYGILRRETFAHEYSVDRLMTDLASGDLPPFAFIEPNYLGSGGDRIDEHPPGMPQVGQQWVEGIVRALMASPAWGSTALFITWDENGGLADHVPPPAACAPDDTTPVVMPTDPPGGTFARDGFRVPMIVVSPWARTHHVAHAQYDHASLLRFVEARFGLPAMTRRDANAPPLTDLFDFTSPPRMTPPTLHPSVVPAPAQATCNTLYPGTGMAF